MIKEVDVEEIGVLIADMFYEENRMNYSQIIQEIWASVYDVTDAIDEVIKRELKKSGFIYYPNGQIFTKDVDDILSDIGENMDKCLDSLDVGYSITYDEYEDGCNTIDMVLYGTEDERAKAIGELNNIEYVSANTHEDCTGIVDEEFYNEESEDIHIYMDIRDLVG